MQQDQLLMDSGAVIERGVVASHEDQVDRIERVVPETPMT